MGKKRELRLRVGLVSEVVQKLEVDMENKIRMLKVCISGFYNQGAWMEVLMV